METTNELFDRIVDEIETNLEVSKLKKLTGHIMTWRNAPFFRIIAKGIKRIFYEEDENGC